MLSAVLYTMANVALRRCVSVDPFLVSAVKAAPTVILLGPLLIWMACTDRPMATSYRMLPRFAFAALLGQVIGNAGFQVALGIIGLAASVPITLGTMIVGGGVLGRIMLREPVGPRTILAMLILISAVVVLALRHETPIVSDQPVWWGALCAAASGLAYAYLGVVMRMSLTGGLSPAVTMFTAGVVGTIALWLITLTRAGGLEACHGVTQDQWVVMGAAGVCNFTAFSALSLALKGLPVVVVNLINASQVAMAATAGVLMFAEPISGSLVVGIGMTLAGLAVLATGRKINIARDRTA